MVEFVRSLTAPMFIGLIAYVLIGVAFVYVNRAEIFAYKDFDSALMIQATLWGWAPVLVIGLILCLFHVKLGRDLLDQIYAKRKFRNTTGQD